MRRKKWPFRKPPRWWRRFFDPDQIIGDVFFPSGADDDDPIVGPGNDEPKPQ